MSRRWSLHGRLLPLSQRARIKRATSWSATARLLSSFAGLRNSRRRPSTRRTLRPTAAAAAAVPVVSDLERGLQLSRQQAQARSAAEDELPPPAATMEAAAAAPGVTASSSSPPPPDESAAPADAKPTLAEPIESPAASIVAEPEAEVKDILGQPYSCAFGNGPALVEAVPAAGGTASTAPAVAAEEPVEVALAPPSTAAESAAPAAAAAAEPPAVGASESAAAAAHLASDPAADNTEAAKPVVEPPGR